MIDIFLPLVGLIVGVAVGMTGVGAGSIMTPILLAAGFSPVTAVGTDLLHSAISKAFGVSLYVKGGAVNMRVVGYLMAGSLIAVAVGGFLFLAIRASYGDAALSSFLKVCIGLILLAAGSRHFVAAKRIQGADTHPLNLPSFASLSPIGFFIGLAVSLTSVGAGSMLMPYLMKIMNSTREMVGTDLAYGFLLTLVTGLFQFSIGNVLTIPLLYLLVGSVPGTYLGVKLNERIRVRNMRLVLSAFIISAGIAILVKLVV